ncbi:MAG: acyl-CoA thioesterase [Flavobacteriaceae bacterium]
MTTTTDLLSLLTLDKIESNIFKGHNKSIGTPHVFGGQVLAQALNAAYGTIHNGRILHSMHAYFLEAGVLELPIEFHVSQVRDGGSFSVRRVTANQNGKTIFILSASFHKEESGYCHQTEMKLKVKPPEALLSWSDIKEQYGEYIPKGLKSFFEIERPVEFKPTSITNPLDPKNLPPVNDVWFKLRGNTDTLDLALRQQILTYISDYNLLTCALNPHAAKAHWGNTQTASLDHSMWYFRDFDFTDWLLYTTESPSASNARGLARGHIYTREGKLVASVAQEGLLRPL